MFYLLEVFLFIGAVITLGLIFTLLDLVEILILNVQGRKNKTNRNERKSKAIVKGILLKLKRAAQCVAKAFYLYTFSCS